MIDKITTLLEKAATSPTTAVAGEQVAKSVSVGKGLVAVGVGVAMLGCLGVGLGQGIAAGKAAEAVGRNPEANSRIRSLLIIGMAISESSALYSLVISFLLLFTF